MRNLKKKKSFTQAEAEKAWTAQFNGKVEEGTEVYI